MHKIYTNIKKLRLEKGWTQTDLANKVGYTDKSMISKIEKGEVDLTLSKVELFADTFGVTPSQLMGIDNTLEILTPEVASLFNRMINYKAEVPIEFDDKLRRDSDAKDN